MEPLMDLDVVLQQDEDGVFIADVPALPGCHSQGATQEEALAHVREAIQGYLKLWGPPSNTFVGLRRVQVP